jgi:uncharacterized membrane protein YhhN
LFLAWIALLGSHGVLRTVLGGPSPLQWCYSSIPLSLAAWGIFVARRSGLAGPFTLGIAVGMTFGLVADHYPILEVKIPLFALGHVAYIAGCWHLAGRLGLRKSAVWRASLVPWLLCGVMLWYLVTAGSTAVGPFRWPTLVYTTLLSATAGTMTALALQDRRFLPMALGAVLFLASDVLLGIEAFRHAPWATDDAVWLTYEPGQMLIVFGAAAASERAVAQAPSP